jgi:LysR family nod box-dependent transcriptional activator
MRFNGIDLNLLVALDALLTEKNVTLAGERLFLSQSAMSGALSRLRAHFDDELIVRVGRSMILSPFAETLVHPVQDLLLQTQSVLQRRSGFDPTTSKRHLRIGASDFVIDVFLSAFARRLEALSPNVTLELYDITGLDASADLEKGATDFLIVPSGRASRHHPSMELFKDSWCVLADKNNRKPGPALDADEYLRAEHVAVNFGHGDRQGIVEQTLAQLGLQRKVVVWAPNYHVVPQMIARTQRIATAPLILASRWRHKLLVIPAPIPFPPIDEIVQWNRHQDHDPGIIWVRELLRKTISASVKKLGQGRQ